MNTRAVFTTLALFLGVMIAGRAQMNDVAPDHWAYQTVRDLAEKGIVLGYPDGNFLGARNLTRYEMATIVKRLLDNVNTRMVEITADTTKAPPPPAPVSVSRADLDAIRRLVEEYKVELTVIGTEMASLKERLDKLEADGEATGLRLQGVEDAVNDPEGPVQSATREITKLKQTKLSGYGQFRYQNRESTYNLPGAGGAERNQSYFYTRRARVAVEHTFKEWNSFKWQVDVGQGTLVSKDVYLTYPLMKANGLNMPPVMYFGQFNYPFGFEIQQSSSDREFMERSRGERALFAGERDRGIKVDGTLFDNGLMYQLGVINGQGVNDGSRVDGSSATNYPFRDLNSTKDVVGRLVFEPLAGKFAIGASGYYGQSTHPSGAKDTSTPPKELWGEYDKSRYGLEARVYPFKNLKLLGEYVIAEQYNPGRKNAAGVIESSTDSNYWYAAGIYSFAKQRNAVGLRYDWYDPDSNDPTPTQVSSVNTYVGVGTWSVMAHRWLSESTKVTLQYDMPDLPTLKDGTEQNQNLFTVQLQYKF